MNYYRRFIGDYQSDTGHLSVIEHGAYTLLLDLYYATGRVPKELDSICRIVRAISPEERKAVESILAEFWVLTEVGWVNERAAIELDKVSEYREKQSIAAKARHKHGPQLASGKPQASSRLASSEPMPNQIHSRTKSIPDQKPNQELMSEQKQVPLRRHARKPTDLIWFTQADELGWKPEAITALTKRFQALTEKNGGWESTLQALSNWHTEAPRSKRKQMSAHKWLFVHLFPKQEREALHAARHRPAPRTTARDRLNERNERLLREAKAEDEKQK